MLRTLPGSRRRVFGLLPLAYIAPGANHLCRLTLVITDQLLRVVDPAVASVLPEKSVLDGMTAFLEQLDRLGLHSDEFIGVHASAPKIRVLQVFLRIIPKPVLDVFADESWREVSGRSVAVNHCGRTGQ